MNCPDCGSVLKGSAYSYICSRCKTHWKAVFKCNICGSIPSIIESCGSVSFFCETCKTLKSREDMEKIFSRAE